MITYSHWKDDRITWATVFFVAYWLTLSSWNTGCIQVDRICYKPAFWVSDVVKECVFHGDCLRRAGKSHLCSGWPWPWVLYLGSLYSCRNRTLPYSSKQRQCAAVEPCRALCCTLGNKICSTVTHWWSIMRGPARLSTWQALIFAWLLKFIKYSCFDILKQI